MTNFLLIERLDKILVAVNTEKRDKILSLSGFPHSKISYSYDTELFGTDGSSICHKQHL